MADRTILVPESDGPYRLGRHVRHDPRSLAFPAKTASRLRSVTHAHIGPVLDQGRLGSCTGNAIVQCLNTEPLHRTGDALLVEHDAMRLYSEATAIDPFPGQWPPDDTGSDGLDACKAAQKEGLISSYGHTFSGDECRRALVLQPVMIGSVWFNSMFTPDPNGRLRVVASSGIAGGHEYVLFGLDVTHKRVSMLNSWSVSWGDHGTAWLTWTDLDRLLARQGDCTVPQR